VTAVSAEVTPAADVAERPAAAVTAADANVGNAATADGGDGNATVSPAPR
jgi:hypothetical protein